VRQLEKLGYCVEWRMLRACDFGAPTTRQRFFLIARCDGKEIIWPDGEYADPHGIEVAAGVKKPWRPVADVLNFDLPCPSIFDSSEEIYSKYGIRAVRPLSDKTMRRIFRGLQRFVIENPRPYIVKSAAYNLIQYHDEQTKKDARGQQISEPVRTLDASNRYGLVSAFITQFNNHCDGSGMDEPIGTMTAQSNHFGEVMAYMIKYYNSEDNLAPVDEPLHTITAHDRMGLVTVRGQDYKIIDIGLRMLTPRELFDAQGFPHSYIIDRDADGNEYPRSEQVARCGNSVCPPIPTALVRANLPELCAEEKTA
jgi:DNA (cytosine-5)-methyltransferase 1